MRTRAIKKLQSTEFDTFIIGGGINGAVSASVLSQHGASVGLIDAGDFASQTSQASSNLIWGGIKYLESYEFRLVRNLCMSRNELMRSYPTSMREIRFYAVCGKNMKKPRWLFHLGSYLYWFMGNCFTKRPRSLSIKTIKKEEPLVNTDISSGGVEYSDAYLTEKDARFSFRFIQDAWDNGACCVNYCTAESIQHDGKLWQVQVTDSISGEKYQVQAKSIINAAGPYAAHLNDSMEIPTAHSIAYSKGVHLIVPEIIPREKILTFFSDDDRLFFAIPMDGKTCIGTTDTPTDNPKDGVTQDDRDFILRNINQRLNLEKPLNEDDIISERCGVRPLVIDKGSTGQDGNWMNLSRKHILEEHPDLPFFTIYGGKLTDCLNIGKEVYQHIKKNQTGIQLDNYKKWYGEASATEKDTFLDQYKEKFDSQYLQVLWQRYGTHADQVISEINDEHLSSALSPEASYNYGELHYAYKHEMAVQAEDFLRRRSHLAMICSADEITELSTYFDKAFAKE